jgi:hypothetical protein
MSNDKSSVKLYGIVGALILIIAGGVLGGYFYFSLQNQGPDYPEGAPLIHNPVANYQNVSYLEPATEDHHSGIHFCVNTTKTIIAPFDARVEYVEMNDTTGYTKDDTYIASNGFSLILRYNEEYISNIGFEYFHPDHYLSEEYIQSKCFVSEGEWVEQGDPLGEIVNFSQDTHVCWPVWHDKNPDTSDVEINKSWCMFTSMKEGLANELDDFYQDNKDKMIGGTITEHICWCWDNHADQIN